MTTFAERLEQARASRGMSREALSRAAGLHHTTVQKLVDNPGRSPLLSTAIALCEALGAHMVGLFTGEGWENGKPKTRSRSDG